MLLKAYLKSDVTGLYNSGRSQHCLLLDSLPFAECFACAAAVLWKNTQKCGLIWQPTLTANDTFLESETLYF